jgi:hypothetical protein
MFGKLNRESFRQGVSNAKNFLGNAYTQTKNILNNVDHSVNILKQFIKQFIHILRNTDKII